MMEDIVNDGFEDMQFEDDTVSFLNRDLVLNTPEDAVEVVFTLQFAGLVKTLELSGNFLGVQGAKAIAAELEAHPELERCLWSDLFTTWPKNEIPEVLEVLGKAMIKAGAKIKELDLSDNALRGIGADAMKEFLESPSAFSLEVLKLNNNGLGAGGIGIGRSLKMCLWKSIFSGGENRLRLKTFIAGRNQLGNPGALALAATIKSLKTIEWLDVRQNGIQEEGIRALIAALKHNPNLRYLCLQDNSVMTNGAKAIANTLEFWPNLEVLNLSECLLYDSSACTDIVDSLNPETHQKLKHVYLSGNELTPLVASLLIIKWKKFDEFDPKPVLHIHNNSFGLKFQEILQLAPENVDVGEKDDDLGSVGGYLSDNDTSNSYYSSDSDDVYFQRAMDRIGQLESAIVEDASRVILGLSSKPCEMSEEALERAVKIAEISVKRVETMCQKGATTQLVHNILDQCAGTGDEDWGYNAEPTIVGRLLTGLLRRGYFQSERDLIQY